MWLTHPEAPPGHLSRPLLTAAPGPSLGPAHSPPWDLLGSLLGPTQTGPSFTAWTHSPCWDGAPPPQDSTVWVPAQTPPAQQRGSRAADEWPRAWTRPRTGALTPKGVPSSPGRPTDGPQEMEVRLYVRAAQGLWRQGHERGQSWWSFYPDHSLRSHWPGPERTLARPPTVAPGLSCHL